MNNVLNSNALEANRKGRLTFIQGLVQLPWVGFAILIWAPAVLMLVWGIRPLFTGGLAQDMGGALFALVVGLIMGGAMLYFGYVAGGNLLVDLLLGQVRQVEGEGMKYSGSSAKSGRIYHYGVGNINFQIPRYANYKKLVDCSTARAYYLSRSKTLVNLEWGFYQQHTATHPAPAARTGDAELDELLRLEQEEQRSKG